MSSPTDTSAAVPSSSTGAASRRTSAASEGTGCPSICSAPLAGREVAGEGGDHAAAQRRGHRQRGDAAAGDAQVDRGGAERRGADEAVGRQQPGVLAGRPLELLAAGGEARALDVDGRQDPVDPAREVPAGAADQQHHGRHERHPHEEGVEDDAGGERRARSA